MKHLTIILLVGEHFKCFGKIFSRNFILIKKKSRKMFLGSIIALIFHQKINVHREKWFLLEVIVENKTYTQVNHIIVKY